MNKWIHVEDQLPKDYEDVLFFNKSYNVILVGYYWHEKRKFYMTFTEAEEYFGQTLNEVTHWMELPEPPKENDE